MTFSADIARDRTRAAVVWLADIQLLNSGPLLRLADRNVIVSGVAYTDYLAVVSGIGDTLERASSGFNSAAGSITFRNQPYHDGTTAYAYLTEMFEDFPIEGAAITLKECFLDDDGTPAAPETRFIGNLDSPREITGLSFQCQAIGREAFVSQQMR